MRRRFARLLLSSLAACLPVLGLFLAIGPAANASVTTTHPSARAQAASAARAFIRQLSIGQHATNRPVSGHAQKLTGLTKVSSDNWSGYADVNTSSHTYSTITGKWTEPTASCTSTESLAAFWVGIDGFSSDSVEQDGTIIECYESTAYYYSWWEMYPTNDIQIVGETVRPGDSISASVVKSGAKYALKVTDSTHTANSFTTTQTCSSCADSSAEWIAEAPSGSSSIYPLTDYKSWHLTSATVKSGSTTGVISTFPDDEITMVDGSGNTESAPGALSGGNSFYTTWKRST